MAIMQRALRAEIAQDAVGDAVRELVAAAAVGEQAAERPDHRVDRLSAERVQPVDQRDLGPEPGGFERSRHASDAGADDADVRTDLPRRCALAPHDARRRHDVGPTGHSRFPPVFPRVRSITF